MVPTAHFRWLIYTLENGMHPSGLMYVEGMGLGRVLQQWWDEDGEPSPSNYGEWRDIPMIQEE